MPRTGWLIALSLCAGLGHAQAAVTPAPAPAAAPASSPAPAPAIVTEIAPGDFVRRGADEEATAQNLDGIANIGFIVGNSAVAVIDPGGSLADGEALRRAIRQRTGLPIRYVIATHAHPDHVFGGAAFLADHAVFVGHARLPGALAQRDAYDHGRLAAVLGDAATGMPVCPTMLVQDTQSIDLGGRVLSLRAWPSAHTDTDLTILDGATRTLWAGDLLFVRRVPALDGSLKGWLAALDQLERVPAVRAVPGHGPASVAWPAGDVAEKTYLLALLRDVRGDIAKGEDIPAAVATAGASQRGGWALFDAYNGRNVTEAYKELQWE
jgi:quinoprotein relay system zinc metallohydrolase 2